MQNHETALALIPLLPLVGFTINALFGKRLGRRPVAFIACVGPAIAFVLACRLLGAQSEDGAEPILANLYTWIQVGDLDIGLTLLCDRLTALMLMIVTGVGTLIHIYSTEYMATEEEGGYARYFAYLNLFTAMMLVLITGASLPLMFVGWEGVGLCSYLLIGFWYKDLKNARAGRKAFIVNRIGDFGFLLGIFVLFTVFGTLDFVDLAQVEVGGIEASVLTTACLLLFVGAAGKSAQIPLYVWLPDAMAGPTPVSALIHAATMVTAGVYMIARLGHLFAASATALLVVASVGAATALFAATMAMTETDLKKVLAYSTVSQLGYMFVGVGSGVFAAGIFHLTTHAFFKALLFLAAGAVMHALHSMDMTKMGGLRKKMPITFICFTIGALALAGLPPFSGFFSKDEVLTVTFANFLHHAPGGTAWLWIWVAGVVTAGLTAFYTIRALCMTFLGTFRGSEHDWDHAHDPGYRILMPLIVLAVLAFAGGFLNVGSALGGGAHLFHFLEPVLGEVHHGGGHMLAEGFAILSAICLGAGGAALALWLYTGDTEGPARALRGSSVLRKLH
ncbi:MAG: NADH-quinone oxidoreductase subunit L, partial [Planctomycetota bacterium]